MGRDGRVWEHRVWDGIVGHGDRIVGYVMGLCSRAGYGMAGTAKDDKENWALLYRPRGPCPEGHMIVLGDVKAVRVG